mmetsp:Transcript_80833/g.255069  ORF Transcript_80833/g.255069 Transcript_80833/m.255069 type:complete len:247 (+) Transcript_80833:393-1133(+)
MSQVGGFMLGRSLFSASSSFALAGSIRAVWKAPDVFSNFACMAPAFSVASLSLLIALCVPAQEKPLGKRMLAIWQTSPPFACSAQSFSRTCCSRPATESIACGLVFAASAMASPRTLTSCRPCSKVKTPAVQRAVYSPSDKPATQPGRSTASGRICFSLTRPAMPARNMAGWQTLVSSSTSSGPSKQIASRSLPRTDFAIAMYSFTSGLSFKPESIFTYCDPWPGKSRPMLVGGGPVSFFFLAPGT